MCTRRRHRRRTRRPGGVLATPRGSQRAPRRLACQRDLAVFAPRAGKYLPIRIGLLPSQPAAADASIFQMAAEAAGFTHGHPTGQLAAGAFAVIIGALVRGYPLDRAVENALALLERYPGHEETSGSVQRARSAARRGADFATMESLGQGWTAEEALAMAVYAALARPEPDHLRDALALAVTHSGDSDSTGSICGNILGAWHGETALPAELAFEVEGRGTILQLADDLASELTCKTDLHGDSGPVTRWTERYPGW